MSLVPSEAVQISQQGNTPTHVSLNPVSSSSPAIPCPDGTTFTLQVTNSAEDIPRLTEIHVVSLADDPAIPLKFSSTEALISKIDDMLTEQMCAPEQGNWYFVKAVSDQTAEVLGWASWHLETPTAPAVGNMETQAPLQKGGELPPLADTTGSTTESQATHLPPAELPIRLSPLRTHVRTHTRSVFATWVGHNHGNRPYLTLRACFVHPDYQRRGVGSSLVRYGTQLADNLRLPTLVQATAQGKRIYELSGVGDFRVFDVLDIDLEDWGGEKGKTRLWFMVREPRPSFN